MQAPQRQNLSSEGGDAEQILLAILAQVLGGAPGHPWDNPASRFLQSVQQAPKDKAYSEVQA